MLCPSFVSMLTEFIHGSTKKALWHLPGFQVIERLKLFRKYVKLENELAEVDERIRDLDLSKVKSEEKEIITDVIKRYGKAITDLSIMNCLLTAIKRYFI